MKPAFHKTMVSSLRKFLSFHLRQGVARATAFPLHQYSTTTQSSIFGSESSIWHGLSVGRWLVVRLFGWWFWSVCHNFSKGWKLNFNLQSATIAALVIPKAVLKEKRDMDFYFFLDLCNKPLHSLLLEVCSYAHNALQHGPHLLVLIQ